MITIAIVNQKAGVAKTTTAVNLAVGLAHSGKRVLLIDLDPQAHAALSLCLDKEESASIQTVAALFCEDVPLLSLMVKTAEPNLTLVPASIDLVTARDALCGVSSQGSILRKALERVKGQFDYVLLDCGPYVGFLFTNAIIAADKILVPTRLCTYSLAGLDFLLNAIGNFKQDGEYDYRILLTMVKKDEMEQQRSAWKLLEPFAERLLTTQIRKIEAVEHSLLFEEETGKFAVVLTRPSIPAGQDYQCLVKEIAERWPA